MTDDEADMYYDRWLVAKTRVKKLEKENERLRAALVECRDELDEYYDRENPGDDPINTRRRQNNYTDNPARIALEKTND
jgi:hypothetical protein